MRNDSAGGRTVGAHSEAFSGGAYSRWASRTQADPDPSCAGSGTVDSQHRDPSIAFASYEQRLDTMQSVMQSIQQAYLGTHERAVVVLEGWDTAGKGGIVRRLGWALDPRSFKVYPIAAPLSHERGRHYLQRFWEKLPDPGQIVVFDLSLIQSPSPRDRQKSRMPSSA